MLIRLAGVSTVPISPRSIVFFVAHLSACAWLAIGRYEAIELQNEMRFAFGSSPRLHCLRPATPIHSLSPALMRCNPLRGVVRTTHPNPQLSAAACYFFTTFNLLCSVLSCSLQLDGPRAELGLPHGGAAPHVPLGNVLVSPCSSQTRPTNLRLLPLAFGSFGACVKAASLARACWLAGLPLESGSTL